MTRPAPNLALGLAAKPMLVTLPFVLLLLEIWPLDRVWVREADRRTRWSWTALGRLTVDKLPFLLLAAPVAVVTFVLAHREGAVETLSRMRSALGSQTPSRRTRRICRRRSGRRALRSTIPTR
jgi:hypothetical protein